MSEKNVGMEKGGFVELGTWDQQNMLMLSCRHSHTHTRTLFFQKENCVASDLTLGTCNEDDER